MERPSPADYGLEQDVERYRQRMAKRGIADPLPFSYNWSLWYIDELGVTRFRWDTGESIGYFYPGLVRVAQCVLWLLFSCHRRRRHRSPAVPPCRSVGLSSQTA